MMSNSSATGGNSQLVHGLKPGEREVIPSPILKAVGGFQVASADLEIEVTYQLEFLPWTSHKRFRFGTGQSKEGEVRWFHRPVAK